MSRELVYPLLQEGIRRFASLEPPLSVEMAQRLSDYYHLDPLKYRVEVVDVLDRATAGQAVAYAGAYAVYERIRSAPSGAQVSLALGNGRPTKLLVKALAHVLQTRLPCPDFCIQSLVPADLAIEDHPFTFACHLENHNEVVLKLNSSDGEAVDIAVFDVSSSDVCPKPAKCTFLLADPGSGESLRRWLKASEGFIRLVLDFNTAAEALGYLDHESSPGEDEKAP